VTRQVTIDPRTNDPTSNARGAATTLPATRAIAATTNLTGALALVLSIAAIAVAVVFVGHAAHLF